MKRALALAVMAILSPAMNLVAGRPVVPSKEVVAPPPRPSSYFRANELDLGIFATYGTSFGSQSNSRGIGSHTWGGGANVAISPHRQSFAFLSGCSDPWIEVSKPVESRIEKFICGGSVPLLPCG